MRGGIFLHEVQLGRDVALTLTIKYKRAPSCTGLRVMVGAWTDLSNQAIAEAEPKDTAHDLALGVGPDPVTAIGLHVEGPVSLFHVNQSINILDIFKLVVKPQDAKCDTVELKNADLVRVADDVGWTRFRWDVPTPQKMVQHLPYSVLTGPFSHFDIYFRGTYIGRSHTLAYVWDKQSAAKLSLMKGAKVDILMKGTISKEQKLMFSKGKKFGRETGYVEQIEIMEECNLLKNWLGYTVSRCVG